MKKKQEIKKEIDDLSMSSEKIYEELHHELLLIPNIVDEKVPEGLNENDNNIIKVYGQIKDKDFKTLVYVK